MQRVYCFIWVETTACFLDIDILTTILVCTWVLMIFVKQAALEKHGTFTRPWASNLNPLGMTGRLGKY